MHSRNKYAAVNAVAVVGEVAYFKGALRRSVYKSRVHHTEEIAFYLPVKVVAMLVVEEVTAFGPFEPCAQVISARFIGMPKGELGIFEFFRHIFNVAKRAVFLHGVHKWDLNIRIVLIERIVNGNGAVVPFVVKSVQAFLCHNFACPAKFGFGKESNACHLAYPTAQHLIAQLRIGKRAVIGVYLRDIGVNRCLCRACC